MKHIHLLLAAIAISSSYAEEVAITMRSLTVDNSQIGKSHFSYILDAKKQSDQKIIDGLFMPHQANIFLKELSSDRSKPKVILSETRSTPTQIKISESPTTIVTSNISKDGDLEVVIDDSEKLFITSGQTLLFKLNTDKADTSEFRLVTIERK